MDDMRLPPQGYESTAVHMPLLARLKKAREEQQDNVSKIDFVIEGLQKYPDLVEIFDALSELNIRWD